MKKQLFRYACIGIVLAIGIIVFNSREETLPTYEPRDYPAIAESGVLRAVTEYNAVSYYASNDTVQGFDYELLNEFAKDQNLRLELTPEMSFEKRLEGITEGRYDILATETAVTTRLKDSLLFTHTLLLGKQVLVQRKPSSETDSLYIRSQLDLANKTLHVIKNSPSLLRIHNLINEIADTIYIREVDLYGAEQLIAMVAGGDIDYAVCDENIVRASIDNYPNLDIDTDISFTQFYAWGINKHSPALRDTLNVWLDGFMKSDKYHKLYKKYFR